MNPGRASHSVHIAPEMHHRWIRSARVGDKKKGWDLGCGDAAAYAYDGWAPGEPNQSARSASLAAAASVRASIEGVAPTVD